MQQSHSVFLMPSNFIQWLCMLIHVVLNIILAVVYHIKTDNPWQYVYKMCMTYG